MDYASELEQVLKTIGLKVEKNEDVKELVEEAQELVDQLKIDAQTKNERSQAAAFEERLRELKNRALLFDGGINNSATGRLVSAKDRVVQGSQKINETQQIINDIEETGADIMSELQRNRETIENINGNVKDTKANLDKADKTVTRMGKWWSRW